MRILGIDPGIRNTGWGVVSLDRGRLVHVANGVIKPDPKAADAMRLAAIAEGVAAVIATHRPECAAIEEIFVAKSAASALKLGMARGVAMMQCAGAGLSVTEIAARQVKKAVVGTGSADKAQISAMVTRLLSVTAMNADSADALAIAIAALNSGGVPEAAGSGAGGGQTEGLSRAIEAALARDAAGQTGGPGGAT
jgi:crossover junction endodeoxyribonuclease RuvC